MAKETLFDHPPKGHVAITAYDPSVDKWRAVEVDASGRLEVVMTAGHKYIDRGDPAAHDFDQTDLTMDNLWHVLDLSDIIIDSDAVLVHLLVGIRDDVAGTFMNLREYDNDNAFNTAVAATQAANVWMYGDYQVTIDPRRIIAYKVTAVLSYAVITVRGWWRPVT